MLGIPAWSSLRESKVADFLRLLTGSNPLFEKPDRAHSLHLWYLHLDSQEFLKPIDPVGFWGNTKMYCTLVWKNLL